MGQTEGFKNMKPSLIVLGAPGSGKGTQAEKISKYFGYIHLSTGDMLRSEIEKGSDLGLQVKDIMSRGELVSDDVVLKLLEQRFKSKEKSYLLDGFPRNLTQAKMLTEKLQEIGCKYKVVFFDIDLDVIKDRVVNRRTCKNCGEIYNIKTKPFGNSGECLKCGSLDIVHRKDDTEEVVVTRLEVFKNGNDPILNYYKSQDVLVSVNAQQTESEVFNDIKKIIESF